MNRSVWSPQAIRDVESIRAFIAQDSPAYGELIAERLVFAVERLQEFPESGRIVPERQNPAIREVIVPPYRIVYGFAAASSKSRQCSGVRASFRHRSEVVQHLLEPSDLHKTNRGGHCDLEAFIKHLVALGRSTSTRNHCVPLIRAMSRWAVRKRYRSTPLVHEDSDVIRRRKEGQRHRGLECGEEEQLLAAAEPHLRALIVAALECAAVRASS